jgi:hypothetical protein
MDELGAGVRRVLDHRRHQRGEVAGDGAALPPIYDGVAECVGHRRERMAERVERAIDVRRLAEAVDAAVGRARLPRDPAVGIAAIAGEGGVAARAVGLALRHRRLGDRDERLAALQRREPALGAEAAVGEVAPDLGDVEAPAGGELAAQRALRRVRQRVFGLHAEAAGWRGDRDAVLERAGLGRHVTFSGRRGRGRRGDARVLLE